jgi:hypothetical protein
MDIWFQINFYLFLLSFKINVLIRSSPRIKNYIVF